MAILHRYGLLLASALTLSTFGCANHIDSYHEDGRFTVTRTVNAPTAVPTELQNYVPWFEQSLENHGFVMGSSSGPHALQLQLVYQEDPQEIRISVYLMQGQLIIMRAVASNNGGPPASQDKESIVTHLVDTAIKAFNAQMDEFSPQLYVLDDKPASIPPSAPAAGGAAETPVTAMAFGTAFATNSRTTYVTARHVIADGDDISLYCGAGKIAHATVLAIDTGNDLAVLQSPLKAPAFLELAPPDSVSPGDHVFTMGYPTPDLLGVTPKYTDGAISALSGLGDTKSLMQISVPIQPGNSGGPLVDTHGRVVGVIDSTAAVKTFFKDTGGALPQNVNFAVGSYYLYPLVKDIQHSSTVGFAKLSPVKRVTASLCLVVVKIHR